MIYCPASCGAFLCFLHIKSHHKKCGGFNFAANFAHHPRNPFFKSFKRGSLSLHIHALADILLCRLLFKVRFFLVFAQHNPPFFERFLAGRGCGGGVLLFKRSTPHKNIDFSLYP